MELKSDAFENNGIIPSKYTCDGENISPPLTILDVPKEARSLVLIMDDPDAMKPAGKIWDHWIVFNIPIETTEIFEGKEPEGSQGITSFGKIGYGGPCPPDGEHSYIFKLYALNIELDSENNPTKDEIFETMKNNILETSELIGRYKRE